MLLAVLIELCALNSASLLEPVGRMAQGWLFRLLPPEWVKRLHTPDVPQPYTISTLLDHLGRPLPQRKLIQKGDTCWLRLTSINPDFSQFLLTQVLPGLPERLALDKHQLRIDGYTLSPAQHTWANQTSYADIAQREYPAGKQASIRMEFATPTLFHTKGLDLALPIPERVFESYWRKWNLYAPASLHIQELWPEFAAECIWVSELSGLNTERWLFSGGARGGATGFTGTVSFSLANNKHRPEWTPYLAGAYQVMDCLGQFAFYCGTGYRTTWGLGQTRIVGGSRVVG